MRRDSELDGIGRILRILGEFDSNQRFRMVTYIKERSLTDFFEAQIENHEQRMKKNLQENLFDRDPNGSVDLGKVADEDPTNIAATSPS